MFLFYLYKTRYLKNTWDYYKNLLWTQWKAFFYVFYNYPDKHLRPIGKMNILKMKTTTKIKKVKPEINLPYLELTHS